MIRPPEDVRPLNLKDTANKTCKSCFPEGVTYDILKLAFIVLFYFAADFPSVSHEYLLISLVAAHKPNHMINLLVALYQHNEVLIRTEGNIFHFLTVLSGVLQGCPASSNLFVMALNPILTLRVQCC